MKFRVNWTLLDATVCYYIVVVVVHCICSVASSEFPERECCDTVYSSPPNSEPVQPTSITHILPSSITGNHTGMHTHAGHIKFSMPSTRHPPTPTPPSLFVRSLFIVLDFMYLTGSKEKIAILSCILARQLCFEDPSCSAILEIIPRVCGPVPGE